MTRLILSADPVTKLPPPATVAALRQAIIGPIAAQVGALRLGVAHDLGVEYVQAEPLSTWIFSVPVGLNRRPNVDVYDPAGELVDAHVTASTTVVTITFPAPFAGTAVLT